MAKKRADDERRSVKVALVTAAALVLVAAIGAIPLLVNPDNGSQEAQPGTSAGGSGTAVHGHSNIVAGGGGTVVVTEPSNAPAELHVRRAEFDSELQHNIKIFIQNEGGRAALITKAVITVEQIWPLHQSNNVPRRVTPTGHYRAELPVRKTPYTVDVPMEQHIPPQNSDAVVLTLSTPVDRTAENIVKEALFCQYVYRFKLSFEYNGSQTVAYDDKFHYLPVGEPFLEPSDSDDNRQAVRDIAGTASSAISSKQLLELIRKQR